MFSIAGGKLMSASSDKELSFLVVGASSREDAVSSYIELLYNSKWNRERSCRRKFCGSSSTSTKQTITLTRPKAVGINENSPPVTDMENCHLCRALERALSANNVRSHLKFLWQEFQHGKLIIQTVQFPLQNRFIVLLFLFNTHLSAIYMVTGIGLFADEYKSIC